MKNTLFHSLIASLFAFAIMLAASCTKDEDGSGGTPDPCANVSCLNGGDCDGYGNCDCPPGYYGSRCQNYDPCYALDCQNGGTCVNGSCDCPEGFYGEECENARIPRAVRITRIDLLEWPEYRSNGSVWDNNSGRPDIFLSIEINGTRVATTGYHEQCSLSNEYPYTGGQLPVYVPKTSYKVMVWVWDYDGSDGSENMGGVYFFPDNHQSTLPSTRVIGNSDLQIKYRVHYDWVF